MESRGTLTYRQAHTDEAGQLSNLAFASYSPFRDVLEQQHWQTLEKSLQNKDIFSALITKSRSFVCEAENRIVGMAFLVPSENPWDIFEAEWSYIRFVGVDPEFQGLGIGKQLTALCINHAIKTEESIIALHTSEMMDSARHIYEKLGFRKLKEIEPRFGKRYWLYTLNLK
jgi:ribosomal protein S18 acetylase RimI-like enzyme